MPFRPKSNAGLATTAGHWSSKIKSALVNSKQKRKQATTLSLVAVAVLALYLLTGLLYGRGSNSKQYPAVHGYYLNEIPSRSPLIYPSIEHRPVLKELGVKGLFVLRIDFDKKKAFVFKSEDKPMTEKEKKELDDQNKLVKRSFLDHGKLVYRKNTQQPEVVVVTLVDFANYELESLIKIVQNRVDYAQEHSYGVYVRWAQEFIPAVEKQTVEESYEHFKPLVMRAAMHAFPQAKYFWFIDQDALIMRMDLSLQQHLLDPKILDLAVLKNVPVVKDSNIRTYKHFAAEDARVIIPQTSDGQLDSSSFVLTADVYGKAFTDYLGDPLVRNYPWSHFSACLGHVLQWHPSLLAKTALVVPKTIASVYDPSKNADQKLEADTTHYTEGDLVVSFRGCKERGSCEADIAAFYEKIKK